MLKVSRHIEAQLRENLRQSFDTTLPRFDVMAALNRYEEGLRMSALSGVLRVSNGNVTGIVDRLVSEGLVKRTPVPDDGRAFIVRLTARGKREFARQAQEHQGWVDELMQSISGKRAEHLVAEFGDLYDQISEARSDVQNGSETTRETISENAN
jgi:DNA-binding MarR family transcriptional regulator